MTTNITGITTLAQIAISLASETNFGKATYDTAVRWVDDNPTFHPELPKAERVRMVQASIGKMIQDLKRINKEVEAGQQLLF